MKSSKELVSQLMSTPIVSVEPTMLVGEVLRLAEDLRIHHFPIVDGEGLFGIVCTCDLKGARPEQAVSQFAHRDTVTVTPRNTVGEAAARMMAHGVGSVVVVDEEGVWGILTREDLAETAPGLMPKTRCAVCSTRKHLHRGLSGPYPCTACEARARADVVQLSAE